MRARIGMLYAALKRTVKRWMNSVRNPQLDTIFLGNGLALIMRSAFYATLGAIYAMLGMWFSLTFLTAIFIWDIWQTMSSNRVIFEAIRNENALNALARNLGYSPRVNPLIPQPNPTTVS